jgi:hypothetical protein
VRVAFRDGHRLARLLEHPACGAGARRRDESAALAPRSRSPRTAARLAGRGLRAGVAR